MESQREAEPSGRLPEKSHEERVLNKTLAVYGCVSVLMSPKGRNRKGEVV